MDWIMSLQRAIDYIEEHITEELDYSAIARIACSSSYHFQKVFGLLCGRTLGQYIRERRLTLAGSELSSSDLKVIDAALKYGYDSPESFCRAFTKFHGVTPSQAKAYGNNLKSLSKLTVKLALEGGNIMNYRIEKKAAFKVIEKVKMFSTRDESALKEIPDIIVSDVMMPKMDGVEMSKALKADIRTSHVPIILLTAKSGEESKLEGLMAGVDDYITKPFNLEILKLKIHNIQPSQITKSAFKNGRFCVLIGY